MMLAGPTPCPFALLSGIQGLFSGRLCLHDSKDGEWLQALIKPVSNLSRKRASFQIVPANILGLPPRFGTGFQDLLKTCPGILIG